jgi:hypothetical protein
MFVFLSGVFIAARAYLDFPSAAAGVLLVVSCPIFTIYGTSGGFDMFSALFFSIVFVTLFNFMRDPTPASFTLFWVNVLMFCNIRYESFMYMFIIVGFLAYFGYFSRSLLAGSSFLLSVTPVLFLPTLWQRILAPDFENAPGNPMFSAGHLKDNFIGLVRNQLNSFLPYPHYVHWAGFILLVYLLAGVYVRRAYFQLLFQRRFIVILLACVGTSLVFFLAYYAGFYGHPSDARFFILPSLFLVLMPLFYFAARKSAGHGFHGRVLLFLSVMAFFIYHPVAVENRFINTLILNRQTLFTNEVLDGLHDPRILAVSDRPGQLVALGYGAVSFQSANARSGEFLTNLSRHLFRDIIVVQRISETTGQPVGDDSLGSAYVLEPPIAELQTAADEFVRVSRVKK